MKTLASLAALLCLTATASAESYDATQPLPKTSDYVGVSASVGAQRGLQAAVHIDGGRRLDDSPLFVRGQITAARSGEGELYQARVGLETRGCVFAELACAFAGADVGYQRDLSEEHPHYFGTGVGSGGSYRYTDSHDVLFVPRAGVELGQRLKLRGTIELPFYRSVVASTMDTEPGGMGVVLSAGVGYAF